MADSGKSDSSSFVGRMAAGVADHAGWAIVVCVAGREVIDGRRIELLEPGLPSLPHHHDAQKLPIDEAADLIQRVRASAKSCAAKALRALPAGVSAIAIRKRPTLPPTLQERLTNYRAQNVADTVMFRDALVEAAQALGWQVSEYETKTVMQEAARALGVDDLSHWIDEVGKTLGPPWRQDHRVAMAAAIASRRGLAS